MKAPKRPRKHPGPPPNQGTSGMSDKPLPHGYEALRDYKIYAAKVCAIIFAMFCSFTIIVVMVYAHVVKRDAEILAKYETLKTFRAVRSVCIDQDHPVCKYLTSTVRQLEKELNDG